ncbi:hypothetical protein BDA96_10G133400 [Sorghum bicolor]|uniref:Uncharacterized protein n=1 Tax=Sorghum bicolor TaxID=4558 RepID=A0A921U0N6_SORBI|nr:hypothetical protein BDA96_10G133400 [Sorghum bicolor]
MQRRRVHQIIGGQKKSKPTTSCGTREHLLFAVKKPRNLMGYLSGLSSLNFVLKSREAKKVCGLSIFIWAKGGREPSFASTRLRPCPNATDVV